MLLFSFDTRVLKTPHLWHADTIISAWGRYQPILIILAAGSSGLSTWSKRCGTLMQLLQLTGRLSTLPAFLSSFYIKVYWCYISQFLLGKWLISWLALCSFNSNKLLTRNLSFLLNGIFTDTAVTSKTRKLLWNSLPKFAGRFFGLVTKHACDGQMDRQTDRQNYDSQDRAGIAALRGKNGN